MGAWLRLAVLCFCVASIMAGVINDGDQTAPPPKEDPTSSTTEVPTTPAPCHSGDKQADSNNCHKFTECKDGIWQPDSCFWFRKFDSVTLKCVMWGARCAHQ